MPKDAQGEPMSASGQPDYAQEAPVTIQDRIDNNGWVLQSEPVGPKPKRAPMAGSGALQRGG